MLHYGNSLAVKVATTASRGGKQAWINSEKYQPTINTLHQD
jgi:hypothetical protein